MDMRKAMKMAPSIFLLKSHVREHQRRSKSGAVTQVSSYETSRQAAEAASKKANDHQAKQDWNKPDTKGGAKLHTEAGLRHLQAMHAAHMDGNSEAMRGHYYKASHHLASADHHLSFNPKDRKEHARVAGIKAEAVSSVADQHKHEETANSLDYGSNIHLLAAEQHNRARDAHSKIGDEDKASYHKEASIAHGKKASEIANVSVEASEHAWNASDRARIGGDKPEHHLDAMRAHRKAAALNYDSEGRAEHEKAAKEHGDKAAEKIGAVKREADDASNKADKSGSAEDHKTAMEKHQEAAKNQPEHLRQYHKEMAEYHGNQAEKAKTKDSSDDDKVAGYIQKYHDKMAGSSLDTAKGWVHGIGGISQEQKEKIWKGIQQKHFPAAKDLGQQKTKADESSKTKTQAKDPHPNVIGRAEKMDDKDAAKASQFHFGGKKYYSTGKKGDSVHDGTPTREFEHKESGHRTWLDDKGRVHADSNEEAKQYRKEGVYAEKKSKGKIKKSYAEQLMDLAKSARR